MTTLTIGILCSEAKAFSEEECRHSTPALFGVTDGKAVGTYLEHKFSNFLDSKGYQFVHGNSASGIDFPNLKVDVKFTSIRQPQSSCPFKSARQKIYGLGYSLIVFVYDKNDDTASGNSTLAIKNTVLVESDRTADFQMTKGLLEILKNDGNRDDLISFLSDKNLPADEIEMGKLADEIIKNPPNQGYLTISNALQWRLQYTRVIEKAGFVVGVNSVHRES